YSSLRAESLVPSFSPSCQNSTLMVSSLLRSVLRFSPMAAGLRTSRAVAGAGAADADEAALGFVAAGPSFPLQPAAMTMSGADRAARAAHANAKRRAHGRRFTARKPTRPCCFPLASSERMPPMRRIFHALPAPVARSLRARLGYLVS